MNDVKATPGLRIGSITLHKAGFDVLAPEREGQRRIVTRYESKLLNRSDASLTIDMRLEADGFIGEEKIWGAWCHHRGEFAIEKGCELNVDKIVENYAPAYLYAFAREFVADLTRRSMKLVVLPPAVFSPASKPATK